MTYLLRSSLLLTLLYGCFALLLSRETYHKLNRVCLIATMLAALTLPAVELRLDVPWADRETVGYETAGTPAAPQTAPMPVQPAPILHEDGGKPTPEYLGTPHDDVPAGPGMRWPDLHLVLRLIYGFGFAMSLWAFLRQTAMLRREIRGGIHTRDEQGNTVVVCGGDFAPHSFLHYIIISADDYGRLREPILRHEQAHVRLGHSWDILLLCAVQAVQWFNPFVHLLGRDLRAVHEYEADNAVLQQGIDATKYQLLLVTKAVGNRLQTLANSLNHGSLKKRIIMMHKKKSENWRKAKGALLPMLMAMALAGWAKAPLRPTTDTSQERAEASRGLTEENDTNPRTSTEEAGESPKAVAAWLVREDEKNPRRLELGDCFVITWTKGTWVETSTGENYIEDRPINESPWGVSAKTTTVRLDGKELDIHHLPDVPASAVKRVKLRREDGHGWIDLTTTPVQIPAGIKGNVNPELTVLLTGTVPEGAYMPVSIWQAEGIKDSFDWKQYGYISWTGKWWNISDRLRDVALRKDHRVRINVTRQGERHIARMTEILKACGITNYEFVKQG